MKRMTGKTYRKGLLLSALIVLTLTIASPDLHAAQMTPDEVRSAVQTWLRTVTADARADAFVADMEPYQVDGRTVAYIAHLSGGGFCLCGADDLVLPVYFYSPQGTFRADNPDHRYILDEIATRTKDLREGLQKGDPKVQQYLQALQRRSELWQDLMAGRAPRPLTGSKDPTPAVEPVSLVLDFASQWSQGSPYNQECPGPSSGQDHALVGGVATAMAQIMNYWQWPPSGEGTGSVEYVYSWRPDWAQWPLEWDPDIPTDPIWVDRLQWVAGEGGKLMMRGSWDESLLEEAWDINDDPAYQSTLQELASADGWQTVTIPDVVDFAAATYDWSQIEDIHTDPWDASDAEVAKLCHHAGVAVSTYYGMKASTSTLTDAQHALVNHFQYDPAAFFTGNDVQLITEELLWQRPVQFRGEVPGDPGRSWVVYGYNKGTDPDRQFLVNMGWGGAEDGWYSCDEITYWYNQGHVVGIAPEKVVRFVGGVQPGDGSPFNPYQNIEEAANLAPDDVTLVFKTGTEYSFNADTLVIDFPCVIKGTNIVLGE